MHIWHTCLPSTRGVWVGDVIEMGEKLLILENTHPVKTDAANKTHSLTFKWGHMIRGTQVGVGG